MISKILSLSCAVAACVFICRDGEVSNTVLLFLILMVGYDVRAEIGDR